MRSYLIWFIIALPMFKAVGEYFILAQGRANPVEFVTHSMGNGALFLLLVTLWISPMNVLLPQSRGIHRLKPFKRRLGLGAFSYLLLHLGIVALDQFELKDWIKPFILSGFVAFLILLIMFLTSFKGIQRRSPWRKIHRLVYLTLPLLAVHITLKEEGNLEKALIWLLPLALAELGRLGLFLKERG